MYICKLVYVYPIYCEIVLTKCIDICWTSVAWYLINVKKTHNIVGKLNTILNNL